MVRVLLAMSGLGGGGITSMVMQYVKYLSQDYHIDFLVYKGTERDKETFYAEHGCKIYEVDNPLNHYFRSKKEIKEILKKGKYDVIQSCNFLNSGYLVKFAKEAGIKGRIVHSHASAPYHHGLIYNAYQHLMRNLIYRNSTLLLACSESAGRYLFENHPFTVLPNAIEADKYAFNNDIRNCIRKEYGIPVNAFVAGTVAMIDAVKNQKFLLKILEQLDDDFVLMIVGDGIYREELMKEIKSRKLENRVIITGWKTDAYMYYSAFDCFVLPSFSEGFPVVSLEAQANGLYCIVSDKVTKEIQVENHITFLGIEDCDVDKWKNKMNAIRNKKREEKNVIKDSDYDIRNNIKQLEIIYRNSIK